MQLSHVVGRPGQVFKLLRGWVAVGRLGCWVGQVTLSNGARLVLSCSCTGCADVWFSHAVRVSACQLASPLGAGCVLTGCGVEASGHGLVHVLVS